MKVDKFQQCRSLHQTILIASTPTRNRDSVELAVEGATGPETREASNKARERAVPLPSKDRVRIADVIPFLEAGRFNPAKLDEKKLKAVIQRLLTSRSSSVGHLSDGGQAPVTPGYIIIGWFLRGSMNLREKLLRLNDETDLFKQMRKGIRSVRGWRGILSLKSLKSFSLYRVST